MTDKYVVAALVDDIKPHLAGKSSAVQGAALADLLAIWLAGHHIEGNAVATSGLRNTILAAHLQTVLELIPINAKQIGTTP